MGGKLTQQENQHAASIILDVHNLGDLLYGSFPLVGPKPAALNVMSRDIGE